MDFIMLIMFYEDYKLFYCFLQLLLFIFFSQNTL
jgi:hypothetical protein